jgi:hypothetical protein
VWNFEGGVFGKRRLVRGVCSFVESPLFQEFFYPDLFEGCF